MSDEKTVDRKLTVGEIVDYVAKSEHRISVKVEADGVLGQTTAQAKMWVYDYDTFGSGYAKSLADIERVFAAGRELRLAQARKPIAEAEGHVG